MKKALHSIERLFTTLGPLGLSVVSVICLHAVIYAQSVNAATEKEASARQVLMFDIASFSPDQTLWSDKARAKFEKTKNDGTTPLAVIIGSSKPVSNAKTAYADSGGIHENTNNVGSPQVGTFRMLTRLLSPLKTHHTTRLL